jgi:protein gp37
MTVNKTAIEWCDYTWNPVTGCNHGCPYCYARKIAERFRGTKAWPNGFEPMFHPDRLDDLRHLGKQYYTPLPKGYTIFVCSMADLFGEWVPDEWINRVMSAAKYVPRHTYLFLTKNPKRYLTIPGEYLGQKNFWFGTTITNSYDAGQHLHWIRRLPEGNTFVSFEPLLGEIKNIDLTGIKQVIVGAQTNPSVEVSPEMVQPIGLATCPGPVPTIKMFCKDSMPSWAKCRRELCWQVHK